ncbi:helix-turn-helix domain-containing protein [candidate division KSB1 bacterium]|nr:helix-turn-helix domain-containing protein [candidate division KSB1 bacterium]
MDTKKRKRLQDQGWSVGSTQDFLGLSDNENIYIELKITLGENLKKIRLEKQLTQVEFAKVIRSNQSRIAKMEAGDPSVSIDLQIKSLLALGTSRKDLAKLISTD